MVIVKVLVIYLLIKCGAPLPAIEKDVPLKYEEYIVEHEISSMSARNSVLAMDISSINTPSGCHKCNSQEEGYCLGTDLINDHCCCDKRYHEMFPYIPHTCYLGPQLCRTVATDCTEYHRILTCCCQKLTAEKWKAKSGAPELPNKVFTHLCLLIIFQYTFL